jgi:hypothetical protein
MVMYSQNSPSWKYKRMGISNCLLGKFGCTTSCVASLGSYFGDKKTPADLADTLRYTKSGLLIWKSIDEVMKHTRFKWRFYTCDVNLINKALKDPDTAVLLNVDRGFHWVSLLGNSFGMFKCSDPYPYPAKTRLYKKSDVVGGAILTRA